MRKLLLTKGEYTLLDNEDYEVFSKVPFFFSKDGYAYVMVKEGKIWRNRLLSRLIMKAEKGFFVDHINHNKLDNRRKNLRICTPLQSSRNRRAHKDSKSGFIGVSSHIHCKTKPWRARIFFEKEIVLGYFPTKEDAAKAYNNAAKKYFGEFAHLNKINA